MAEIQCQGEYLFIFVFFRISKFLEEEEEIASKLTTDMQNNLD